MTKREAVSLWRSEVLPGVRAQYETDGVPDYPARREAWNAFIDLLQMAGDVTRKQADTWSHPPENTAPWERSR